MEKRLININEASLYLGLTKNTLYAWVCQRKIPYVKCGRLTKFDMRDIDAWITCNRVEQKGFDISGIF